MELKKYYFTYGSYGQDFVGGWTEVEAPDIDKACEIFREHHPDRHKGVLNCSTVYSEEQFKRTKMYAGDNWGFRCHEVLREETK